MTATLQGATDFRAFLDWSRSVRRAEPGVASFCETRIARAFAGIRPEAAPEGIGALVHRCDLAKAWCEIRGIPGLSERSLVCEGVRHALSILFAILARANERLVLPRDVYPVYFQIAADAGLSFAAVDTFPSFELSTIFAACSREGATHLLLPNPLKLHGRHWTLAEVTNAISWLSERSERRLVLDGAYSFGLPLHDTVKALLVTDQVIYLDSLSKGWLHERVFGAAIVPARDVERYLVAFRSQSPTQRKLRAARKLLCGFATFPALLTTEVDRRRGELVEFLARRQTQVVRAERGYFLAVESDAQKVLEERGVLTIPLSVFGGTSPGWCFASALPTGLE